MDRDLEDVSAFLPLGPAIKVLVVWPRFPASFWSLGEVMEIVPERSLVPPLGLITVAALCPKRWEIRLLDLAFEELTDEDLRWANLVMVSAMEVQREEVRQILERASRLSRRTMIGGPYASSEPEVLQQLADHVVVGEPDEIFQQIATDLEAGSARRLYRVTETSGGLRLEDSELLQISTRQSPPEHSRQVQFWSTSEPKWFDIFRCVALALDLHYNVPDSSLVAAS